MQKAMGNPSIIFLKMSRQYMDNKESESAEGHDHLQPKGRGTYTKLAKIAGVF